MSPLSSSHQWQSTEANSWELTPVKTIQACIRGPPKDWRCRTGKLRQTWLRTVEDIFAHSVYCMGLVTACWRNSRLSKMQQHMSWPEQGSLTTVIQYCINSTGFRYGSKPHSSWRWSPLHGLVPSYLADVCIPVSSVVGRWQLRSADSGTLIMPHTRTTISQQDFAMLGPATWNSLPVKLRTSTVSIETFAQRIKSHLFSCWRPWGPLSNWRYINVHIRSFNCGLATASQRALEDWHGVNSLYLTCSADRGANVKDTGHAKWTHHGTKITDHESTNSCLLVIVLNVNVYNVGRLSNTVLSSSKLCQQKTRNFINLMGYPIIWLGTTVFNGKFFYIMRTTWPNSVAHHSKFSAYSNLFSMAT